MKYKSIVLLMLLTLQSYTHIFSAEIKSIDDLLSEIRAEQKLEKNEKINPDKVGMKLLEELGVSVMKRTIWNQNRKEPSDKMISTSLSELNRGMGYSYLMGMTGNGGMMPGYNNINPGIKESSISLNDNGIFGNGNGWLMAILFFFGIPVLTGVIVFFSYRKREKK